MRPRPETGIFNYVSSMSEIGDIHSPTDRKMDVCFPLPRVT